ncbi:hypothetical protein HYS28_01425 [Candidatus Uhrbacteria bacterium]|nr:hypothetical protein [Candidatus Uhrbacteria bacterium]
MLRIFVLGIIIGIVASLVGEGLFGHDSPVRARMMTAGAAVLLMLGLPDLWDMWKAKKREG